MTMGDSVRRAGLDTIAAKDAAVVVDVIDLGVALGSANAIGLRVVGRFDVNAIRGAGGRAQEAGHALFQAVLVALQDVHAAKALLEHSSPVRTRPVGIVLHLRRLEHLAEGDAHAFSNGGDVFDDSHKLNQYTNLAAVPIRRAASAATPNDAARAPQSRRPEPAPKSTYRWQCRNVPIPWS